MNPSSRSSQSASPPVVPIPQGVLLTLEACDEWKIQEIGYDGVEKYIRPETFTDNVGKLASKVEWMKIVGSDSAYDNAHLEPDKELDDENVAKPDGNKPEELVMPEVGPWNAVANESLQQLNVLLDDLNVAKNTDYMKPLTVLDPITVIENGSELVLSGKGAQWIWKRRAFTEAAHVLETAQKMRQKAIGQIGLSEEYVNYVRRSEFFEELKKMRDIWRIRKSGDHIYGDLSYHIFGTKYESHAIFDITRNTGPLKTIQMTPNEAYDSDSSEPSRKMSQSIAVTVPKDLARRSLLFVTVVKDEIQSGNLYSELGDEHFALLNVDEDKIKEIAWKKSLQWAQNTLLCRDIFNMLCKDAIKLRDRLSIIRDNVLLVSLFDDYLLRFELKWFPFEEGELNDEGDAYLGRVLRELVVGFESTKFMRPQIFIPMPITHLPEALDSRGCMAFTAEEIKRKSIEPKSILERMLEIAGHYQLVQIASRVTEEATLNNPDPILMHKWLNCSRKQSKMIVYLTTKDYEPFLGNMRTAFHIEITSTDISIETKEGIEMKCQRDPKKIEYGIKYCISLYNISLLTSLAKNHWTTSFQTLHANVHALDGNGMPAPSMTLCNQSSTKVLIFIFHVDQEPEIRVRKFLVNDDIEDLEEHKWRKLDYEKLVGSTLCNKLEILLSFLRDA